MRLTEIVKIIFYGIVEGITEWLPVSSTGHLILFESIWPLSFSDAFLSMFRVVIQLGAILAVCVVFWDKLWPFRQDLEEEQQKSILDMWIKVIIGCVPAAIAGFLLDDFLDAHLFRWPVVALALIIYGVAFIVIEKRRSGVKSKIKNYSELTYLNALEIGLFQTLSLIPGTSRSGASILGAMLVGTKRTLAAEFSLFMAVPIMFGASGLKLVKYLVKMETALTAVEVVSLILGMLVAFVVSLFVVRFLMNFVRRYSFAIFGYYRIILGVLVFIMALARPGMMP
jgi:undecaprenyl-diphosphatase